MGKLLSGHYGHSPEAEAVDISLRECNQKLGLKPNDFVSEGQPKFFEKSYGTKSRYLLFLLEAAEIEGNAIWKPGYYLLPLEAADVLKALDHKRGNVGDGSILPIEIRTSERPPDGVLARARRWAEESQPLFFKCGCTFLELKLDPPWAFRKRWRARLRCSRRCQPALTIQV
ncbi:MAG: hypothetical protein WC859_02805 [Elusimicrobiota bacterium]